MLQQCFHDTFPPRWRGSSRWRCVRHWCRDTGRSWGHGDAAGRWEEAFLSVHSEQDPTAAPPFLSTGVQLHPMMSHPAPGPRPSERSAPASWLESRLAHPVGSDRGSAVCSRVIEPSAGTAAWIGPGNSVGGAVQQISSSCLFGMQLELQQPTVRDVSLILIAQRSRSRFFAAAANESVDFDSFEIRPVDSCCGRAKLCGIQMNMKASLIGWWLHRQPCS